MGLFDVRAFADAAGMFNTKSEKVFDKWFPWKAANDDYIPLSKFANLDALRPKGGAFEEVVLKPVPAQAAEVVVIEEQTPFYSVFLTRQAPRNILTLKANAVMKQEISLNELFRRAIGFRKEAPVIIAAVPQAPAAEKPRKTLTLKTKVDLPVISGLARASSLNDLSATFKSEMRTITERKADTSIADLHDAFTEKRRHPLSHKTWKELMAEAYAPPQKAQQKCIDLAAVFKRELQALEAAEARTAAPLQTPKTYKIAA